MISRVMNDPGDVVVLVDDHHRQVALAGFGDGEDCPVAPSMTIKLYSVSRFIRITSC